MRSIQTPDKTLARRTLNLIVTLILAVGIGVFGGGSTSHAALNRQLSFSASLRSASNRVLVPDGTYAITFSLYRVAEGGTPVWSEVQPVFVQNGVVAVNLGVVVPLPESVNFNDSDYFLGIKVGADDEMTPRQQVGTVPSALNASTVNGASVGTGAGNVLLLDGSGNIGIQGGASLGGGLSVGGSIVPTNPATNLGSSAHHFASLFVDSLTVGTTDANGTSSPAFSINTAGSDGDTSSLRFYLGPMQNTYAALQWNGGGYFQALSNQQAGDLAPLQVASLINTSGNILGLPTVTAPTTTDVLVGEAAAQTLSNKTLAAFTLTGDITGQGVPNLAGLGTINTATISGGELSSSAVNGLSLSGGVITSPSINGTISTTGLTIGGNTAVSGTFSASGTINGATLSGGAVSGGSLSATSVNGLSVASGTITSPGINGTISTTGLTIAGDTAVGSNFSVIAASGNTSIGGTLGVTGNANVGSLTTLGAVSGGSLGITNAGVFGGSLQVGGATTLQGSLVADGDVTLGSDSSKKVVIQGTLSSSLVPTTDNTYDLGASNKRFANFYAANAVFDSVTVNNTDSANFVINSAATGDADSYLQFYRGASLTGATIGWNSTGGYLYANQSMVIQGNATLGSSSSNTNTVHGLLVLADSSSTAPLELGNDVNIYRSGANTVATDANLHLNAAGTATGLSQTYDSRQLSFSGSYWNGSSAVTATGGIYLNVQGTAPSYGLAMQTAGQTRLYIDQSGNVGIGNSGPNYKLDVNGDINSTGTIRINGTPITDAGALGNVAYQNQANSFSGNQTIGAGSSLVLTGGTSFPSSPTAGQMFYRTDAKQLYIYENGQWQADRSTATKIVAASNSQNKEKADFVGDGTNDQNAINGAIAALPSGGGIVYLLDGTYNIAATINLNVANTTLTGSGSGTILKRMYDESGASTGGVITISGASNTTVQNIQVNGNKASYASANDYGIYGTTQGCTAVIDNTHIQNNLVVNTGGDGIRMEGNACNLNRRQTITGNTVNGAAGYGLYAIYLWDSTISGNQLFSNGTEGMRTSGGGRVTITGNVAFSNSTNGIDAGATGVVSGNSAYNNTQNGFLIGSGTSVTGNQSLSNGYSGISVTSAAAGVIISGNTVSSNTQYGILLNYSTPLDGNNVVTGNTITSNGYDGIYVTQGFNTSVISSNNIGNSGGSGGYSGIHVWGNTQNLRIVGNNITDTAGTGYAIRLESGVGSAYLADNTYSGTGAASISDLGTGTTYANQQDSNGNIILKGQAGVGLNTASPTTSLQNTGAVKNGAVATPSAPTLATAGTAGSTTYGYKVTAYDGLGETLASTEATIATGNATLSSSDYITITPVRTAGAVSYKVYRTTAGGTPSTTGLIGTIAGNASTFSLNDTGLSASTAVPTANTTGQAQFLGYSTLVKPSVDNASAFQVQNAAGTPQFTVNTSTGAVQGVTLTDGTASLNAGAITGATSGTFSGTLQGATLNATSAINLGGTSINTAGTLTNVAYLNQTNTFTKNGAASTPAQILNGTWYTGGSASTTTPQFLLQPSGTSSSTWNTSGTGLGLDAATGFAGNLIDAQVAGTSKFKVDASGNLTVATSVVAPTITSTGTLALTSASNGNITLTPNGTGVVSVVTSGNASSAFVAGDGGTSNYAKFDTNGALSFSGAARPYSEINLQPVDAVVPGSNGCTRNQTDATNFSYLTLDCPDGATTTSAGWQFKMPQNYVNGSNVQVDVYWEANDTTTNAAKFDIGYISVPNAGAWDTATRTDVAGAAVANAGTTAYLTNDSTVTLTAPSINANDLVSLRVARDSNNGSDSLTVAAKIIGVRIKFLVNN